MSITKAEWMDAIVHPAVKRLLVDLGFDVFLHAELFNLLDADGSLAITAAELSVGLLNGMTPARGHELMEVRLKVREIQQDLLQARRQARAPDLNHGRASLWYTQTRKHASKRLTTRRETSNRLTTQRPTISEPAHVEEVDAQSNEVFDF